MRETGMAKRDRDSVIESEGGRDRDGKKTERQCDRIRGWERQGQQKETDSVIESEGGRDRDGKKRWRESVIESEGERDRDGKQRWRDSVIESEGERQGWQKEMER